MALYDEGVTSESPTETSPTPAPTDGAPSAETQNTVPAPRPEQTVPYGRFAQVNQGWRQEAAARAAAEQRAQQFERQHQEAMQEVQSMRRQLEERANRPSGTPEEEYQRLAAERALSQLPSFARVSRAAEGVPIMAQKILDFERQQQEARYTERIESLEQRLMQSHVDSEEGRLRSMNANTGLNFDVVNNTVAYIIGSNPSARQAFLNGDRTILPEAFRIAKDQLTAQQQSMRADLARTKTSTAALPPRPGGGAPGAAPTLPNANDPDFEKKLFGAARNSLIERMGR